MDLRIKRVYDAANDGDGRRILVDRLWPRGLTKAAVRIDFWAKAIAPSDALRRWYGHDPDLWPEFRKRYFAELDRNPDGVEELAGQLRGPRVTLLYSSKEERVNNAAALKDYLESRVQRDGPPR